MHGNSKVQAGREQNLVFEKFKESLSTKKDKEKRKA